MSSQRCGRLRVVAVVERRHDLVLQQVVQRGGVALVLGVVVVVHLAGDRPAVGAGPS